MKLSKHNWARGWIPDTGAIRGLSRRAAAGFLAGFFILGPLFSIAWILLLRFRPGELIPPDPLFSRFGGEVLSMRVPDPLLVARIKAANRGRRVIIVGSSEMAGMHGKKSVPDLIESQIVAEDTERIAPVVLDYAGSAALRAAVLLERTRRYHVRPDCMIVVVNPHYAAGGNALGNNMLPEYFPNLDSLAFYLRQTRGDSQLRDGLPRLSEQWRKFGSHQYQPVAGLALEIRMTRNLFHDAFGRPVDRFLRGDWSRWRDRPVRYAQSALPPRPAPAPATVNARLIKPIPVTGQLAASAFGESLVFLRRLVVATGTRVRLLILPLNRAVWNRAGYPGAEMQARFEGTTRRLLAGSPIRIRTAADLGAESYFSDPIHFSGEGRARLARLLLKEAAGMRNSDLAR